MTIPYDPRRLRENTGRMAVELLACGIDPQKSTLFIQSLVPEHLELAWILGCVCPYGELARMTQFKDKSKQIESLVSDESISSGLFTYPVLQAADILVYRAQYVPVGKDQEQHLELSRSLARRFNARFGELFPEPEVLSTETPKIASLADPNQKMSKSLGPKHYIGLFEDEASIRAKVSAAVTDTGGRESSELSPGVANLILILRACGLKEPADDMTRLYQAGTLRYRDLKQMVADALVALTKDLRQRRESVSVDSQKVNRMILGMSHDARRRAIETLSRVRAIVGLSERNEETDLG